MKKRIYAYLVYCMTMLLLLNNNNPLYSQKKECGAPIVSELGEDEANDRMLLFKLVKTNIYDSKKVKASPITIPVNDLKSILRKLRNAPAAKSYDGVRIHFLRTDNDINGESKICFLFAPTIRTDGEDTICKRRISADERKEVYLFKNDSVIKMDLSKPTDSAEIEKLKQNYESLRIKINSRLNIDDTKSIWYAEHLLYLNETIKKVDLLTFLDNCDSVKAVEINLGCWTPDEDSTFCDNVALKSDLVYRFIGIAKKTDKNRGYKKGKIYFTLGAKEIQNFFKKQKNKSNNSQNPFAGLDILPKKFADTGLPCPPNKCE